MDGGVSSESSGEEATDTLAGCGGGGSPEA